MRRPPLHCLLVAVAAASCSNGDDACVEVEVEACAPTYEPSFANVFERTLIESCGVAGSSCHGDDGAQGGLVLAEADAAHAALLAGRVEPGDPGCSLIVRRIESSDPGFRMPPGAEALAAGERCAIERWIAAGAAR